MYKKDVLFLLAVFLFVSVQAQQVISDKPLPGSFEIVSANNASVICIDPADLNLVQRSASWLQQDVELVTGKKLSIVTSLLSSEKNIIIIGTIEGSSFIRQLIQQKKLNVDKVKNKWDAYLVQTVANPFKGISSALVITGGNKRGVAYGALELSKQIGVSPWYWWADVPAKKKAALYFKSGTILLDAPKVKYRGIVTATDQKPGGNAPHLLYEVYVYDTGKVKLNAYFSPTLNFYNTEQGLQYAMSIDDETPQILSINSEDRNTGAGIWNNWVSNNIIIKTTNHTISKPGKHIVRYWMVNPAVVLQKIVLDFGGVKQSYLGPPETIVKPKK
jgi:hypothetical protein